MTSSARAATDTRLGHPKTSRRALAWTGWAVAAGVAALDITSTVWASTSLTRTATGTGTGTFGLTLSRLHNPGAAFGFGGAHPVLVLLAAAVSSGAVALALARSRSRLQRLGLAVALGGGLGGGLGNLAVRVVHGSVIDWIHAAPYPATFNLADVAIRGGLLIVLADALLQIVGGRNTQSANEVR
jgi:signal peptidase II